MRVLVTGSRNWTNRQVVSAAMAALSAFAPPPAIVIFHGGAKGADAIADEAALHYGYAVEPPWRPVYHRYPEDRRWEAPLDRNTEMVDSQPDLVLAFMLGTPTQGGTLDTVTKAKARGIPVIICNWPGDPPTQEEQP